MVLTDIEFSKLKIPETGKTADLKVGYDTKIAGPFTKIIEVYSNDSETSRATITIKGNVSDAPAVNAKVESKDLTPAKKAISRK